MAVFNVVGIQILDFVDNNGKNIKGTKFHCMRSKEFVDGYAVETVFVPSDVDVSSVVVGSEVDFITGFRERRVRQVIVLK